MDGVDFAKAFELTEFDAFADELITPLVPLREYEFTCGTCTIIRHRSELAYILRGSDVCMACARVGTELELDSDPV